MKSFAHILNFEFDCPYTYYSINGVILSNCKMVLQVEFIWMTFKRYEFQFFVWL